MNAIVNANKISFRYREEKTVLKDVDFMIYPGQLICLLGPNGVGKSTLLNCVCGLLKPTSGTVRLDGEDIDRISRKRIAQMIAYVPQKTSISFDYSVREFVVMGRTAYMGILDKPSKEDYEKVEAALAQLSIQDLADRPVSELSGGEQQKACIARALVQDPKLIVLDEPTSALDFGNQMRVLKLIRQLSEQGYAILMTTHNPDHCTMLGGDVAILDRSGHLECGSHGTIMTEQRLSEAYETKLKLVFVAEIGRTVCVPA